MSNPQIFGQQLIDEFDTRMGGLSNAFDTDEKFSFLNAGKDSVYAVLKSMGQDYFVDASQAVTTTADDYFAALVTTTREYDLPANTREVRMIECTTSGYQNLRFEFRSISDPEFIAARNAASAGDVRFTTGTYIYTVVGRKRLVFAQYPEAALTLHIWRVVALDDIDDTADELTEILHPFWRGICDYAAKLANLSVQNLAMDFAWRNQWQESVKQIVMSSAPRVSTGPIFISDYTGS